MTIIIFLLSIMCIFIAFKYYKTHNEQTVNIINIKDYIQKDSNPKNHTKLIQKALKDIEKNKKNILFFPEGVYILSSPITINSPVEIKGEEAIIKLDPNFQSNSYGQGFFVANSVNNITIDGITFDGNKRDLIAHSRNNFVLYFLNSSNIIVKNSRVINLNGQGENLNSAFSFVGSSNNINVIKNIVENSDGGAVFFQGENSQAIQNIAINLKDVAYVANGRGSHSILFKGNISSNVSSGNIGVENGASNIRIENNRIYDFTDGYGIGVLNIRDKFNSLSHNIEIKNNIIVGNSGKNPSNGIAIIKANNVNIENNSISEVNLNNINNNSIYLGKETSNISVSNNEIKNTNAPRIVNSSNMKTNVINNNK